MTMVSAEWVGSGQAGFQISNAIRCIWCAWLAHSPHHAIPRKLPFGLHQEQGIGNMSSQYLWFKTANSEGISK